MYKKNYFKWICGYHSVVSALNNNSRKHEKLLVTRNFYDKNLTFIKGIKNDIHVELTTQEKIASLFPECVAHQNIALRTSELPEISLEQILIDDKARSLIVVLDQVTDVGNIGAIVRSAVAFNADAIVLTKQKSPNKSIITKTASGTLEYIPLIYVNNLINAITLAKKNGYWCYGMDERADNNINETNFSKKNIVILGAEQSGMRKLTREHCDFLVKIPTAANIKSLNVASAAAIVLHSIYSKQME